MFLHKSDLIPFIVELSAYISATAVVSLLLKPVENRICFHGASKHINRVVLLFLLGETNHLQGACMYSTSKQPLYNGAGTI